MLRQLDIHKSERTNQIIEQLLRMYCNFGGSDWTVRLPIAEFAYNSAVQESTGYAPFLLNYGSIPTADFLFLPSNKEPRVEKVEEFIAELKKVHQMTSDQLTKSRQRMKYYADLKRTPAPTFQPGDLVWVNREGIPSTKEFTKMDAPRIGPFRVLKRISETAYKLLLPEKSRLHNVFHVSQLTKFVPREGEITPEEKKENIANLVEPPKAVQPVSILREKKRYGAPQFLVRFSNTSFENDQWLKESELDAKFVKDFRDKHAKLSNPPLINQREEEWGRLFKPLAPQLLPLLNIRPIPRTSNIPKIKPANPLVFQTETLLAVPAVNPTIPTGDGSPNELEISLSLQRKALPEIPTKETKTPRRSERLQKKKKVE